MPSEWSSIKEFNPFNSNKLYSQVYRWKELEHSNPAPTLITIDPTNVCNLNCVWCNADYIRTKNPQGISAENLKYIADNLNTFTDNKKYPNVETVCIAGGGEPTNHPYLGKLVLDLKRNGIKSGVVSNGTKLNEHPELVNCEWVGISVDAGSREVYKKLKGGDYFDRVILNIKELVKKAEKETLGEKGQGHGVSYKYLLHPDNCGDVYEAAKIAKRIGCRNLHIRPYGTPWDKLSKGDSSFSLDDIDLFHKNLEKARELEDESFGVFGITHKFDGKFSAKNQFKTCMAIKMTGVFEAPTDKTKRFNFGFCCDRRGDKNLTLENIENFDEIRSFWCSEEHNNKVKSINPKMCPRCTYQPHNKMFEKVIKEENTTYDFI